MQPNKLTFEFVKQDHVPPRGVEAVGHDRREASAKILFQGLAIGWRGRLFGGCNSVMPLILRGWF
jgi:hypothetical protein